MNKPRFVISSPFDTYSGYGARSRDIIRSIIQSDQYQVELLSQRWGDTSWGFCQDHPEWKFLLNYLAKREWQETQFIFILFNPSIHSAFVPSDSIPAVTPILNLPTG